MLNKKILLFLAVVFMALPFAVNALTVTGIANNIRNLVQYLGGVIAIILWVITGVLFLQAQGDPSKATKARTALLTSIAGTIILILVNLGIETMVQSAITGGG